MSAVPKTKITAREYLIIERAAACRSEFYGGEMFAMAGARVPHIRISSNLTRHFGNALAGHRCEPMAHDMRVKVSETGLYTYPDLLIVCGEPVLEDDEFDTLLNPSVIIEVLSKSTEAYDRGTKFEHYRKIESLKEYVLVSQDRPLIESYARNDHGEWVLHEFRGLDAHFTLASLPVRIAMAEIYQNVAFPDPPALRLHADAPR